jgi:hypothetical protein
VDGLNQPLLLRNKCSGVSLAPVDADWQVPHTMQDRSELALAVPSIPLEVFWFWT